MEKNIAEIFRQSLADAHQTLEDTLKDVDEKVAHFQPEGRALPVAAAYAHAVLSEDVLLCMFVTKETPLVEGEWGKKMGLSKPHPQMDEQWEKNFAEWAKEVRMDIPKFREYAQAVYKRTDEFLASLTDKDLTEKKVDLSMWGLGEWPIARYIIRLLIGHVDSITGEISAAKGLQGLKGYPF